MDERKGERLADAARIRIIHEQWRVHDRYCSLKQAMADCTGLFDFAGMSPWVIREFEDCCARALGCLRGVEMTMQVELDSGNWTTCPDCKGEGGAYYDEWEPCSKCRGGGKLRPEP